MRKFLIKILLCLCAFLISFQYPVTLKAAAGNLTGFRAFWVSSAYNMDFPTKNNLTPAEMKIEIDKILDRAVTLGLNAVVVQVRPAGDALYRSDIFPWSALLTGTQGTAPAENFDPFAYWVERAHAKKLAIHAWINPYRVTYPSDAGVPDLNALSASNPARVNPSWIREYKDAQGRWGHYYDPGMPECRQLVANGVAEIIDKYMVDGIHLDDYFYPGTDFPDDASYAMYGGGMNRDDWRRENVNSLIRLIQLTVNAKSPIVRFGVSPTAIWQNKSSTELGSDTRGFESYKSAYADTRRWVKEGWLDYICPQIYWYIGYDIADYSKVLAWWEDVCRGTGVDLYIGHAAYRLDEGASGWSAGELARQLQLNTVNGVVSGDIFFRAGSLNGAAGNEVKRYYATAPAGTITPTPPPVIIPPTVSQTLLMERLTVAQPSRNVTITSGKGYQFFGTCVPGKELYLNGQPVVNRTAEGFFSAYVPLVKGDNVFTLTQEGQEPVTRVVTLNDPAVSRPGILNPLRVMNAYPSWEELGRAGDVITLKCTAPAGADVTVTLPHAMPQPITIPLKQNNSNIVNDDNVYAATYSATFTLPAMTAANDSASLGNPVYTAVFNGQTYTLQADGPVVVQGAERPFFATVSKVLIWAYPKPTVDGGSSWSLTLGQQDRVAAVTSNGEWLRLASGGWVSSDDVTTSLDSSLSPPAVNVLSDARYIQGLNEDIVAWRSPYFIASTMDYDGAALTVRFGMQKSAPPHNINTELSIFESVTAGTDNGAPCYVFTLKPGNGIEGYYMDYADGEVRLHIKKRKSLAQGIQPLAGFNIVLDPGHGDASPGGRTPMGDTFKEKELNLINSQKIAMRLRQMGANVIMTRETDVDYLLNERAEISWRNKPDMFISIHANSLAEVSDQTNIHGLTVWHYNTLSKPAAAAFMQTLHTINPLTNRSNEPSRSNLFVTRPAWTPSIIIEASFMGNVQDFSWLVNPAKQDELAWGVVNAVLAYYR